MPLIALFVLGALWGFIRVRRWERCDHCHRRMPASRLEIQLGSALCKDNVADCLEVARQRAAAGRFQ